MARRRRAQIQRRRTEPTYVGDPRQQHRDDGALARAHGGVICEAGAHYRPLERHVARTGQAGVAEERAPAQRGMEDLLRDRVVHAGRNDLSVDLGGDRHGVLRHAEHEVHGAVDRVDHPAHAAVSGAAATFLSENRVVGTPALELAEDVGLHAAVDVGNHVGRRRLRIDDVVVAPLLPDQPARSDSQIDGSLFERSSRRVCASPAYRTTGRR